MARAIELGKFLSSKEEIAAADDVRLFRIKEDITNDTVSDEIQYRPSKQKNAKDTTAHRALVLQGGGALAAYEVELYGALYFWGRKEMTKRGEAAFLCREGKHHKLFLIQS
jgi:hypothetical protein